MSEPPKTTLDYAPPETKPQYSRVALVCIGFAGAIAAVVNAFVAIRLLGAVAILELLVFTAVGLSMTRRHLGPGCRAFGRGLVLVPAAMLAFAILSIIVYVAFSVLS